MSRRSTKARRAATKRTRTYKIDRGRTVLEHYDPWGRPCSLGAWAMWFESRGAERFLKQTRLPNGYFVSTIWLGIDHGFGRGPPIIFESMVFQSPKSEHSLGPMRDQRRYATRREALEGHEALVEEWAKRPALEVVR